MLLTLQGEIISEYTAYVLCKYVHKICSRPIILYNIFRSKIVKTTLALRTTKFLSKEVEYMPWQTASRNLDYFFLMFDRSEVYGPMQVRKECSITHMMMITELNDRHLHFNQCEHIVSNSS